MLFALASAACVPAGRPSDLIRPNPDAATIAPRPVLDAAIVDTRAENQSKDSGVADFGFVDSGLPRDTGVPPDTGIEPDSGIWPDAAPPDSGEPPPDPPPFTPLYRIGVRGHIGDSELSQVELREILTEVNRIWWFAGVCFEFTMVQHDQPRSGGFDLWFVPEVPNPRGVNGVYRGDHDIWTRDRPSLRQVTGGTDILAARTGAHELGHALNLPHRQDNTNLMASGTRGWTLNDTEISRSRNRARQVAESDTTRPSCAESVFE